jgi:DNA-binding CsgD family transcriptional regulator
MDPVQSLYRPALVRIVAPSDTPCQGPRRKGASVTTRRSLPSSKDGGRLNLSEVPCAPANLEAYGFTIETDEYVILTFRPGKGIGISESYEALTQSERGVVRLVMRGWSNSRIAAARGTSPRTIANQLGAAYRKLGVQSRRELIASGRQPEPR